LSGMILDSSNSVLRNNNMTNNEYNFAVSSLGILGFINDVDISNTVNGKPVYYWINKRDMNIPIDAGYVALVNCTRITVQNLSLTHNGQGVLLAYTTNSTVTKDDITNNGKGIDLFESSNNTIIGNNMTNSDYGIQLINSSNNNISENNMTNNHFGIRLSGLNPLSGSSYNIVSGNNIKNNEHGVQLDYSSNNTFYHNNFINNFSQVFFYMPGYVNFWNNDIEGNYWSDYEERYPNATEINGSGIWDTPYIIDENNVDNYPMVPEFSTWTSMLLLLVVLTVAVAIYKRRQLKTPIR